MAVTHSDKIWQRIDSIKQLKRYLNKNLNKTSSIKFSPLPASSGGLMVIPITLEKKYYNEMLISKSVMNKGILIDSCKLLYLNLLCPHFALLLWCCWIEKYKRDD